METSTPVLPDLPDIDSGVWTKDEPAVPKKDNYDCHRIRLAEYRKRMKEHGTPQPKYNGPNSKLEGGLYNDIEPTYLIKKEKPEHRTILTMKARGYENHEIAEFMGRSTSMVSNTVRQPFARLQMNEIVAKTFDDEIKELLQAEVIPSVMTLAAIRDDPDAPKAVRSSNSQYLVDRWLGKPTQPIENKSDTEPSQLTTKELESEVSKILTGIPATPRDTNKH